MELRLELLNHESDLKAVCEQMQPNNWAADNEMTSYQPDALIKFVADFKNILLLAYDQDKIAGAVLAYEMPHPEGKNYMYVHELDTHPDYRRRGVGTLLMQETMRLAKDRGCAELWLGADDDNPGAQKLYESLNPTEIDKTITYSYKL